MRAASRPAPARPDRRRCGRVRAGGRDRDGRRPVEHLAPSASTPRSRRPIWRRAPTGEATLTKTSSGWRIELDATGLPRRDGGRFYEAWLQDAAGVLVPIGTFNEGRKVTLWAGVSPKDFTDADRHARAGRRRSGVVRREGARRNDHRLRVRPAALDPAHDLLAGAVETAHHRSLADPQRARRLLVREAGDVDGDEDVAEIVGERGDRRVELAGLECGLRLARVRVGDEVELVGQRAGRNRRLSVRFWFRNVLRNARSR